MFRLVVLICWAYGTSYLLFSLSECTRYSFQGSYFYHLKITLKHFTFLVLHYHFVFNQFSVQAAKGVIWVWSVHSETATLNSLQASSFIWSYSKMQICWNSFILRMNTVIYFSPLIIWLSIRFNEACLQSTLNHVVVCTIDITFCSLRVSSSLLRCGSYHAVQKCSPSKTL